MSVNVALELEARARDRPDDLAVAVAARRRDFETLSFAELEARSRRIRTALEAEGIGVGTPVALMVPPSIDLFAAVFALLRLRAVLVLVDPGLGRAAIGRCLEDARPDVLLGIPLAQAAARLLGWGRATVRQRITARGSFPGTRSLEHLERALERQDPPETGDPASHVTAGGETRPEDRAAILFTSGSTGPAKGAIYTHGMFAAQVELLRETYGIEPGERDLATFPLFALFGPALGMAAVVPDMDASRPAAADPAKLVHAIERFRCTSMFASPALVDSLGRHCEREALSLPTLRRVISAGAPASVTSLRRIAPRLTGGGTQHEDRAAVHTPYGATEALPITDITSREVLEETAAATERGAGVCVGRPVTGMRVRILAISDRPLDRLEDAPVLDPESGEIGEIAVSGPVVSAAYVERPRQTELAKTRDADGRLWHRTGDVGYLDDRGRLWMCGRKSHRVVVDGAVLHSVPVEEPYNTIDGVRRTALVGVEVRDRVLAILCVEPEAGAWRRRRRLLPALADRREAFPETRVDRFLFRREFPVDVRHNAKIFRERLAEWAAQRLGGAPALGGARDSDQPPPSPSPPSSERAPTGR